MLIFTDEASRKIASALGQHAPERGGALLGPQNSNLITHFIEDADAQIVAAHPALGSIEAKTPRSTKIAYFTTDDFCICSNI